jgi:hypothetical protein
MTGRGESHPEPPRSETSVPPGAEPATPPAPAVSTCSGRRAAFGFGAVAAAALVVAGFTWLSRPALSAEDARRALEAAFEKGPTPGAWEIEESHGTRFRQFAPDARDPERVVTYLRDPVLPSEEGDARGPDERRFRVRVVSFPRSGVAARVFGERSLSLFFENYAGKPRGEETVAGRPALVVRFEPVHPGVRGPTRTAWFDRETRDLVRIEDRTYDGTLVHGARRLSAAYMDGWTPPPATHSLPRRGTDRASAPADPPMERVVREARFPVYEPARLPAGFRRVAQAYQALPDPRPGRSPWDPPVRMGTVFLRYSDGLARLNIMMARSDHMRRIQEIQAELARLVADPSACPSTADNPEELLAGLDDLIVRRRSDKCSTILQIDRLGGVSIVLSGRNELPPETYRDAMASLAPVPGSTPPPEDDPIEVWRVDFRPGRTAPALEPPPVENVSEDPEKR